MDIVRYYLDSVRVREDVRKRYEDAIALLKMIGRCELSLGLDSVGEAIQQPSEQVDYFTEPSGLGADAEAFGGGF